MIDKPIVCSFSGGETSAYMAIRLKEKYPDTKFVFANTGQENEETLIFADKMDREFGLDLVWIEAVVDPEKGKGTTYAEVDFRSADRVGRVFESVISKYGVPNAAFLHCTRELKLRPIDKWCKENALNCVRAVGIRIDELDRVNPHYEKLGITYPLAFQWPTTKNEINAFWRDMPFRLNLKHYEGNCKWCYKKSFKKLAWICHKNPEHFDFPQRMEATYGHIGSRNGIDNVIFRGGISTEELRVMSEDAVEPVDDARVYEINNDLFGFDDLDACGSESCEAY